MTTLAPILTNDIPTILANPKLDMDPITIATVLNPNYPIILDDGDVIEINAPSLESPPLLQPRCQIERDAKAIANTQVDWRETPTAHIFQVDLPGIALIIALIIINFNYSIKYNFIITQIMIINILTYNILINI